MVWNIVILYDIKTAHNELGYMLSALRIRLEGYKCVFVILSNKVQTYESGI